MSTLIIRNGPETIFKKGPFVISNGPEFLDLTFKMN